RTAYAGEEAERKSVCVAAPGGVRSYHIVNYSTNSTKILISFERKYKDIEPVSKHPAAPRRECAYMLY
ncbi:MAG: hypothetical protein LBK62_14535, partial [Treponema sp.]|nr:hypothetical protein [Treponema sp.]